MLSSYIFPKTPYIPICAIIKFQLGNMSIKNKNSPLLTYSREQLIEEGKLSIADIEKIHQYRGLHNRLGFAYQLLHVRILNYFPQQRPFEIINELLGFAALQINIDQSCIQEYAKHRQHVARHQEHILLI